MAGDHGVPILMTASHQTHFSQIKSVWYLVRQVHTIRKPCSHTQTSQ